MARFQQHTPPPSTHPVDDPAPHLTADATSVRYTAPRRLLYPCYPTLLRRANIAQQAYSLLSGVLQEARAFHAADPQRYLRIRPDSSLAPAHQRFHLFQWNVDDYDTISDPTFDRLMLPALVATAILYPDEYPRPEYIPPIIRTLNQSHIQTRILDVASLHSSLTGQRTPVPGGPWPDFCFEDTRPALARIPLDIAANPIPTLANALGDVPLFAIDADNRSTTPLFAIRARIEYHSYGHFPNAPVFPDTPVQPPLSVFDGLTRCSHFLYRKECLLGDTCPLLHLPLAGVPYCPRCSGPRPPTSPRPPGSRRLVNCPYPRGSCPMGTIPPGPYCILPPRCTLHGPRRRDRSPSPTGPNNRPRHIPSPSDHQPPTDPSAPTEQPADEEHQFLVRSVWFFQYLMTAH